MASYTNRKQDYLARLRRVEGQVRGLQRMVEEDKYCIDVLTQISAIRAALDKVALGLVDGHARHCMRDEKRDADVDELMGALGRMLSR